MTRARSERSRRTKNVERRTKPLERRTTSLSSLTFRGERPLAEADEVHLPLHRILAVDRAGVDAIELLPLDVHRELELDVLALHGAGEIGFTQLAAVVAGELLA